MPLTMCLQTLETGLFLAFGKTFVSAHHPALGWHHVAGEHFMEGRTVVCLATHFKPIFSLTFQTGMSKNCLMTPFPGAISIMLLFFSVSSSSMYQHTEVFWLG